MFEQTLSEIFRAQVNIGTYTFTLRTFLLICYCKCGYSFLTDDYTVFQVFRDNPTSMIIVQHDLKSGPGSLVFSVRPLVVNNQS